MTHRNQELLRRAAEPTAEALRAASARASSRILTDALSEIGERFYEPGLQVADLERRVGASRWFPSAFRREIGLAPWAFIQECRMETATRLLRDTLLPVDETAYLVGYLSLCSFRRLCQRWCGLPPGRFRQGLRRARRPLLALPDEVITWAYWRDCQSGRLDSVEIHRLIEYFEGITLEDFPS